MFRAEDVLGNGRWECQPLYDIPCKNCLTYLSIVTKTLGAKEKMILQLHTFFNSLDLKYSMAFKETKDELIKIAEGKNCWDILEHSKEENEHYFRLNSLIQEYGYISIILRHISIEGLVNDIAFRFLGEKIFYSEIENSEYRLSFIEKIEKVYGLISELTPIK